MSFAKIYGSTGLLTDPAPTQQEWEEAIASGRTRLGLDAYRDRVAAGLPRCDHGGEAQVHVVSRSVALGWNNEGSAVARVCAARACVLAAMSWIERVSDEQALIKKAGSAHWVAWPDAYSGRVVEVPEDRAASIGSGIWVNRGTGKSYYALSEVPDPDNLTQLFAEVMLESVDTGRRHWVGAAQLHRKYYSVAPQG